MDLFRKKAGWRQTLTLIPVFVQLFLCGVTLGWLSVAVYYLRPSSKGPIVLTPEQESWLASFQQLGRFIVTIPACLIMDIVGRKYVILATGLVYLIGWLLAFTVYTLEGIFLSNFFIGIGLGMASTSCQIYTAEIASASLRGVFHAVNSFTYNLGYVVISALGTFLNYRQMATVIFVCTFLGFVPAYWMTESPYYLLYSGRDRKAQKTLKWLREGVMPYEAIRNEYDKIDEAVKNQQGQPAVRRFVDALKEPINRKCIGIVLFLNSMAAFTGFLTIRLKSTNIPVTSFVSDPVQYPMIIACVQLVSSLLSPFLIEMYPRRTLYIVSASGMAVVLAVTSVLFYFVEHSNVNVIPHATTVLVAFVLLYYIVYSVTLITLLFVSKGELVPQNARAVGSGLTALFQAGACGLGIVQYEFVKSVAGVYLNFAIFAAASASIALVVYFYLPETRGKTLAAIQQDMKNEQQQTRHHSMSASSPLEKKRGSSDFDKQEMQTYCFK